MPGVISAEAGYPYHILVTINSTYEVPLTGSFTLQIDIYAPDGSKCGQLKTTLSAIPSGVSSVVVGDESGEITILNSDWLAQYGWPVAIVFRQGGTYAMRASLYGEANEGVTVSAEDDVNVDVSAPAPPPPPTGEVSISLNVKEVGSPSGGTFTPQPAYPTVE